MRDREEEKHVPMEDVPVEAHPEAHTEKGPEGRLARRRFLRRGLIGSAGGLLAYSAPKIAVARAAAALSPGATPPPTVTGFAPTSGGEGTPVTVTGTNFSGVPANNLVIIADKTTLKVTGAALGFATNLTGTISPVPSTATGPIRVVRGYSQSGSINNENISGTTSTSSSILAFAGSKNGVSLANFSLTPQSPNTLGFTNTAGDLVVDVATAPTSNGTVFKVEFSGKRSFPFIWQFTRFLVTLTSNMSSTQLADHLALHIMNAGNSVGGFDINASVAGTNITVSWNSGAASGFGSIRW